jgi:hypothetical protein
MEAALRDDYQAKADVPIGIAKAAGRSAIGIDNAVRHGLNKLGGDYEDIEVPDSLRTEGFGQNVGAGFEDVLEFLAGDEVLKTLSVAQRLKKMLGAAEFLEKYPVLARLAKIGANSVRQGTVGAAQGIAHGETPDEALETGAVTGATGGVLEGAADLVSSKLAPKVKQLVGVDVPVRGSQDSVIAKGAETLADSDTLQKFDAELTQPAAKKAVGNIATDVRNSATETLTKQPLPPVGDFGEAADSIREQSKPVFEKLDQLSGGDFKKAQDLERLARSGVNPDWAKVADARAQQDKIFEKFKGQFAGDELKTARANWRQSSALDSVQESLDKAVHPTPVELAKPGQPDPGYINGKQLRERLLDLKQSGELDAALKDPKHIQALNDLGILLEKGNNVQKLNQVVKLFAHGLGIASVGTGELLSSGLGKILTNEKITSHLVRGLRSPLAPAAIAALMQKAQE